MSISEYESVTIQKLGGPWLRLDPSDVPSEQALLSLNSEYNLGSVGTRKGFAQVWNPNEPIASMTNWIFEGTGANANYLVYYNPSSGNVRLVQDLTNPGATTSTLYNLPGGAGASISSGGTFLFSAVFDTNGNGVGQCRVVSQYVSSIQTDVAFQGPLTAAMTVNNSSTGVVTAGSHRIGYVLQTRNGFLGRLSPVSGSNFTPALIAAPGGQEVTMSVTATWPADAANLYVVFTTANNINRFFLVPGQVVAVPPGISYTANFTINISDADLSSTATDVTDNQLLFTQDTGGSGPFNPSSVGIYGPRTVYVTQISGIPQAYASDPDNPQYITADQHVLYLPGFKAMTTQFTDGNRLYLLGPHWTYAFQDTGTTPVNWPSAQLVDSNIGTLWTLGATFNGSRGFGWVADVVGLFNFQGGAYATLPISYMVEPDWKRINWSVQGQVVDNADKHQVIVMAALDGATSPSHMLMFDYTEGLDPESVKYSLWNILSYSPGAICIVQNPTSKLLELWVSDSVAGPVGRQMNANDTNPYADFTSSAINWQHEAALIPGLNQNIGSLYHHYASQVRATGNGTLSATIYGLDRTKNVTWNNSINPVVLGGTPGQAYTKRYPRLRSESVSYRFTMNTANQYCNLSALDHYFQKGPSFR